MDTGFRKDHAQNKNATDHERGRDRRELSAQCRHSDLRAFRARPELGDNRAHGRDERVPVKSFWQGQEYLYRLVKMLAGGK